MDVNVAAWFWYLNESDSAVSCLCLGTALINHSHELETTFVQLTDYSNKDAAPN